MHGQPIKWVEKEAVFPFQKQLDTTHLDAQNLVTFMTHFPFPTCPVHLEVKIDDVHVGPPELLGLCPGLANLDLGSLYQP